MKKVYIFSSVLLIILLVALFLPIRKRNSEIKRLEEKIAVLETKMQEAKEKNEALKKEIEEEASQKNIEKVSRNRLNMTKDGEKVYKFIEEKKGE